ncbi:MAG: zinc ribbon domain-containing protein [Candidatus Aminicenantes bacterium]|jgi:hypothetical protein
MAIKCPKCQTDNPDTLKFCGECGTQLIYSKDIDVTETIEALREELTTGSTFAGRYQIIEELGKGGMGKVYKAQDTEIKEKVALKLIKPEIAADKNTIERLKREKKSWSSIPLMRTFITIWPIFNPVQAITKRPYRQSKNTSHFSRITGIPMIQRGTSICVPGFMMKP